MESIGIILGIFIGIMESKMETIGIILGSWERNWKLL